MILELCSIPPLLSSTSSRQQDTLDWKPMRLGTGCNTKLRLELLLHLSDISEHLYMLTLVKNAAFPCDEQMKICSKSSIRHRRVCPWLIIVITYCLSLSEQNHDEDLGNSNSAAIHSPQTLGSFLGWRRCGCSEFEMRRIHIYPAS